MAHTILLVDDEYAFLEVLALLLAQEGYEIVTAADGEEALARLGGEIPDLVVTDFWMPRMNGLELFQRMQENAAWRTIPVLLMTAAHESNVPRVAGLAGVLPKPLDFDSLLEALRRLVARPREQG